MDSSRKGRKKKKPSWFTGKEDDIIERFFSEEFLKDLERMAEEILRMLTSGNFQKPIVEGFKLTFDKDGKPKLERFGNRLIEAPGRETIFSEEREPITDIIEGDEEVAVTIEIPGVSKRDIDLRVNEDKLEIKVNNPERKYHKIVELPCKVDPDTAKATYRNGILDVVVRRKDRREEGIHRVRID